jgi:hypothetical protein
MLEEPKREKRTQNCRARAPAFRAQEDTSAARLDTAASREGACTSRASPLIVQALTRAR